MQCDKKIINRLRRAEGQMRGIQKMMEEGAECYDIMMQLTAVRASVDKLMGLMVAENLKFTLENPLADSTAQEEKLAQAMQMVERK